MMTNTAKITYEVVEHGLSDFPTVVFSAPKRELAEQFKIESEKTALQNQQFGVKYLVREIDQSAFAPYRFCAMLSLGFQNFETDVDIEAVFPVNPDDLGKLETPNWPVLGKVVDRLCTKANYDKSDGPFLLAYGTSKAHARERLQAQFALCQQDDNYRTLRSLLQTKVNAAAL